MKKSLLILLFPLLLSLKCEKDPDKTILPTPTDTLQTELDKLPPITTTGANTFACLLNGKAWVANSVPGKNSYTADYYKGITYINARKYSKNTSRLLESIILQTQNYKMGEVTIQGHDFRESEGIAMYNDWENSCEYENSSARQTSAESHGKITILRLDSVERIFSGTFNFITFITNENPCGDTVTITHGRFDLNY